MKKQPGTYIFHNEETGELYVGSTTDINRREKEHIDNLIGGKFKKITSTGRPIKHCNYKFQNAYNKNPNFDYIAVSTENREDALEFEQLVLDEYHGNPLFLNIATDATLSHLGKKQSKETIQKRVDKIKGRKNTVESNLNCSNAQNKKWLETPQSERDRLYQLNKESHSSAEYRSKQAEMATKLWEDPEYRKKITDKNTGQKRTEEQNKAQSIAAKNKWQLLSEEEKNKKRAILLSHNLGRKQSPAEKEIRSLAQKKRFSK